MLGINPKTWPKETHGTSEAPPSHGRAPLVHDDLPVCLVNKLPSGVLSHVFDMARWDGEDRSMMETLLWMDLARYLAAKRAGQKEISNGNIAMTGEDEEDDTDEKFEDEDMDEDEDEDEDDDDDDDGEREGEQDEGEEDDLDEDEEDTNDDEYDWPTRTQSSDDTSPRYPIQTVVPRVCHHWRNVAFSTPSLWTTIVASPQAGLTYEREAKMLERSKNLPIDVIIDFEHYRGRNWVRQPSITEITTFFTLFVRHIHRWRTMKVTTPEYMCMYLFLYALSNPCVQTAPQLKTLELHLSSSDDLLEGLGNRMLLFTLFGGSAPSLTGVVLRGVPVNWNQPWIASASNLTKLRLSSHPANARPSWAQFATILRSAPALQTLDLLTSGPSKDPSEWFIESTHADLNAPIELARLTDLRVGCDSQPYAIALFQRLCLPAIEILSLECVVGDYTEFVLELAGSATTSSGEQSGSLLSRLHTLVLPALVCSADGVATAYGELQNLKSLRLAMSNLQKQFFDFLGMRCTLAGRSGVWLPRLEMLHVADTSGSALCKMLQKRRDAGACLSSLMVYAEASTEVDEVDEKWLRANLKGFDLFIGGGF